jgi:predicted O-methyltransferase YrrM
MVPEPVRDRAMIYRRRHWLARAVRQLRTHDSYVPIADGTMRDLLLGWGNPWSIQQELIDELWARAWTTTGPILDCGSGLSTVLLAIIAEQRGIRVISLEHDPVWHYTLATQLERLRLTSVDVIRTRLHAYPEFTWYQLPDLMPGDFSLVLCDGPPAQTRGGRYGLLPCMVGHLAPGAVILLDDAGREGELEVLQRWEAEYAVRWQVRGEKKAYGVVEM